MSEEFVIWTPEEWKSLSKEIRNKIDRTWKELYSWKERAEAAEAELAALKEAGRYHPASEFPEEDGAYIGWCEEDDAYMPFTYRKDWTVALDPRITGWWNMPQPPEVE